MQSLHDHEVEERDHHYLTTSPEMAAIYGEVS